MGQINYEKFQAGVKEREDRQQGKRVGYFSLKNDKDEAIVRFMHNSPADFDIMYVHPMQINGKFRNVNCIRDPEVDPIDHCPFCAAKKKIQTKIFIHLIEYTKDENGNIVGQPKIWERTAGYISTLKNLCDEYAPLSDNLFKIKRNGAAGSMETTYNIMYAPPQVYRQDVYKKDEEAFNGIKALGTSVMNKTFEQMADMLNDEVTPSQQYQPTPRPTTYNQQPVDNNVPPVEGPTVGSLNRGYEQTVQQTNTFTQPTTRSYNPGSAYVAGQEEMSFSRPKRL